MAGFGGIFRPVYRPDDLAGPVVAIGWGANPLLGPATARAPVTMSSGASRATRIARRRGLDGGESWPVPTPGLGAVPQLA